MGKIMLKAYKYRLYLKESNNRHKARLKVAKLHEKITNQRKNFLQQLSTKLIRENQSIACLLYTSLNHYLICYNFYYINTINGKFGFD